MYAGQQKHVSRAMVEAWCNAAKANASPAAMHKLLQVHMCWAHFVVIVTVHSALVVIVIRRVMLLSVHLGSKQLEERLKTLRSKLSADRKHEEMRCLAMPCVVVLSSQDL